MYSKFKYFILLLTFFCYSCVSMDGNNNLYCDDFDVKFLNNNFEKMLFFDDLKKSLLSKLRLLIKNHKQNTNIKKVCIMKIDVSKSNFMSIINNSGSIGRENIRVGVSYELSSSDIKITGYVDTFYGNDMSGYPYSDYIKNKKNEFEDIETLSEDIFMDIIRQLN